MEELVLFLYLMKKMSKKKKIYIKREKESKERSSDILSSTENYKLKDIFIIYCEGISEENYFKKKIKKIYRNIEIIPSSSKGRTAVKCLYEDFQKEINGKLRKRDEKYEKENNKFLVFDRDDNNKEDIIEILNNIREENSKYKKIKLIFSNPCHEVWHLCKYDGFINNFSNCPKNSTKLKEILKNYRKSDEEEKETKQIINTKIENSKKLYKKFNIKEEIEIYKNIEIIQPITEIFKLIETVKENSNFKMENK